MPEPKVQRLLRAAPIASRRTEGIAIATQSVNRVRCPLKPWGPAGGNGRGPRRKYFRWGNLGGTRRRGLDLTPMSEDGSLFLSLSTTHTPSECLFVPRRGLGGEKARRSGLRRVIKQLRRGAGNRSARVLILLCCRCQGRENFSGRCPRNFSALFLDLSLIHI